MLVSVLGVALQRRRDGPRVLIVAPVLHAASAGRQVLPLSLVNSAGIVRLTRI